MNAAEFALLNQAFPWLFPGFVTLLGLCVGSFLNVVIYRVPVGKSVVLPGSHCACGQPIAWHDNIPVLSWLLLRARARCCGRPVSARYPAVELLTGVLFLLCWLRFPPAVAVCGMVFVGCLVSATFIDLDHMIIPDVFTIGLAVLGVLLSLAVPLLHGHAEPVFLIASFRSTVAALQGVLIGSGIVLWIALLAETVLRKEAMGFGDVKFVGAIGAFCGWKGAVCAVFGGAVVGTVWFALAFLLQLARGPRPAASAPAEPPATAPGAPAETPDASPPVALGFGMHVPFGPMLAIAGAAYFLAFQPRVDAWFETFNLLF